MTVRRTVLLACAGAALVVVACATAAPSTTAPSNPGATGASSAPSAATSPSSLLSPGTSEASPGTGEALGSQDASAITPSPATSSSQQPATGVIQDPTLLGVLPASVDGVLVMLEPQAFTSAAADPAFGQNVEAAAFATVVDGNDLASGVVAELLPGRYSDAFFRDWRTTYDTGACDQAGGVGGHAEAPLGGRTVYITTCSGGLRVYHAYLQERGLLVSLFSLGDRRFGEQLMAGLHP